MSVLFMDGFDTYDDASGPQDTGRWAGSGSPVTTLGPSVARSQGNGIALLSGGTLTTKPFTPASEVWCGAGVYFDSAVGFEIFRFQNITSNIHFSVFRTIGGNIELRLGGSTVVATSAASFSTGVWRYIEARLLVDNVAGSCEVWIDGSLVVSYGPGDTYISGAASVARLELGRANYYDDFYVLSTAGSAPNNTRWGDTRISPLEPAAAGSSTDWIPNGLVNHRNVAENDDGDNTINITTTVGATDLFEYQQPQIPAGIILATQEVTIARRGVATVHDIAPVIRSGGTNYEGTQYALGTSFSTNTQIREVNPDTGLPWTVADLAAIEAGYRLKV